MENHLETAAALIVGGRSRRMGGDKSLLKDANGRELWEAQWLLLRELYVEETVISCRKDQTFPAQPEAELVFDQWPDSGPMGGIISCLTSIKAPRLLALGVDLPLMTLEVLRTLLSAGGNSGKGAVFRNNGYFEPLAAVYSKAMIPEGVCRLESGKLALQGWLNHEVDAGNMLVMDLPEQFHSAFFNLNTPEALSVWRKGGT